MKWHREDTIKFLLDIGAIREVIPISKSEYKYKCKIGELNPRYDYKLQCKYECTVCGRRTVNWGSHFNQAKPYQEHIKIWFKLDEKRLDKKKRREYEGKNE